MTEHIAYWKIAADDRWDPSIVLFLFLMSRKDYPLKVTPGLYCWLSERLYGTTHYQDQVEEGLDTLLQRGRILRRGDELRVNAMYLDQVRWNVQKNDEALAAKKGWAPPKDYVKTASNNNGEKLNLPTPTRRPFFSRKAAEDMAPPEAPAPKDSREVLSIYQAAKTTDAAPTSRASFLDDWRTRQREALAAVAPAEKPRATFLTFKAFITEHADPKTRLFAMRACDIARALGISESSINPWIKALCDLGHLEFVSAYDNKAKKPAVYRVAEIADDFVDDLGDE